MSLFAVAGVVVDEFSVVITPALDARAGCKSIVRFGEAGLAGKTELSLASCETIDHGAVHLRYTVKPGRSQL